jgi:hypothetical protein
MFRCMNLSQIKQYISFILRFDSYIQELARNATEHTPYIVGLFIQFCCTAPNTNASQWYLRERKNLSWNHAMKVRSGVAYYYAYELRFPNTPYIKTDGGNWHGNPVNSEIISRLMKSIKRQKVQPPYFCSIRSFTRFPVN